MIVKRNLIHHSVTEQRVLEMIEDYHTSLDNPGICLVCGEDADGVEPDARGYTCDACERRGVYGAEQILLEGLYHPTKDVKHG